MDSPEGAVVKMISIRTPDKSPGSPSRFKWKISFQRTSSSFSLRFPKQIKEQPPPPPPTEFLCPVSSTLMADPVIVSSGHTFERTSVQACNSLGYLPTLPDGSSPDFSAVIPNLALKSAILGYCRDASLPPPTPLHFLAAEEIVRKLIAKTDSLTRRSATDVPITKTAVSVTDESAAVAPPPLQLKTRPSCCSSSSSSSASSSEMEPTSNPEEEELFAMLKSNQTYEVEEAAISLRRITRGRVDSRVSLCTDRILSAVRSLIVSKYSNIQVNSVAALVNLSLENVNKIKIVRSGVVPNLIEVLRWGFPESQDHACGALFSLALDDHNKTAIGVLGALGPLVNMVRSGSERAQNDSALALYHLTFVQSNRVKLLKTGTVPIFMEMVRSGQLVDWVLLILCNLGLCAEGRATLLDVGAIQCLVRLLSEREFLSESICDNCLTTLLSLSQGGARFKVLAKAAGALELLENVDNEKARLLLEIIKEKGVEKEEEEMDWEKLLSSEPSSPRPSGSTG